MNGIQKIILTLLVTTCSLPAVAQVGELRNNLAIGFSGGINMSNVSFEPKIKQSGLMGINGGITARYISEKYFAMICGLQVELNYSQRGWKEQFEPLEGEEVSVAYSRSMDYLEVPFLAHLAFGKDRGLQFFVNAGPQIGFLLNESEKFSDNYEPTGNSVEVFKKMSENKFDYGILGGAGFELKTKAGNFLVEGRYYFALSDIFRSEKKDFFSRSAFTILSGKITYLFDLRK